MSEVGLHHRIGLVRSLPPRVRLAALIEALEVAPDSEREALSLELLELAVRPSVPKPSRAGGWSKLAAARRSRLALESLEAVVRGWPNLAIETRGVGVTVGEGRWAAASARALRRADRTAQDGVCLLAEHSRDPAMAAIVLEVLVGGNDAGARRADATLLTFAAALASSTSGPESFQPEFRLGEEAVGALQPWSPSARLEIARVVVEGARRFGEHRQKGVLLGGLLLLARESQIDEVGPEARFARILAEEEHPASGATRSVLRWSRAPVVRSLALRLLPREDVGAACVDRLARALTERDHEVTLCQSHLALHPARRRRLATIRIEHVPADEAGGSRRLPPGGAAPDPATIAALSTDARRGLSRWIRSLSADAIARSLALEPLLVEEDGFARHGAARAAPPSLVLDFSLDADERVARHAAMRWSAAGVRGWLGSSVGAAAEARATMLCKLSRSPHPSVRRIAREDRSRHDPWSVTSAASRLLTRHLFVKDRDAYLMDLRARLRGGNGPAACGAVLIAKRLAILGQVETELIALASSTDPELVRAASIAVRVLGSMTDAKSRGAVVRCLEHADPRVRANAVEAVGRWRNDPHSHPRLMEFKLDSHHRIRANAIAALLDGPAGPYDGDAAGSLMVMLNDDSAHARAAAAWVAERIARRGAIAAHAGLVHQLEGIASADPDPRVRWRAARGERAARAWSSRDPGRRAHLSRGARRGAGPEQEAAR
ncbi:MAG: HEAT repeat domain-containing protein [Phycisphaeraceae bacterium]|nr:HEAT repeat domain-containing protein [Phycisphaeraceae bacterium]